jgi:hypothetical protein
VAAREVGAVRAVVLVARCDLRRRWRRALFLIVLVGLVGGLTLAAIGGARRTSSALARFRDSSRSADIELDASPTSAQIQLLRKVHGVAAIGILHAIALVVPAAPDVQTIGAPIDTRFGSVVDRDRIIAGRAASPAAVDELMVGEGFATRLHLEVRDHLEVGSFSVGQVAALERGASDVGTPAGPHARLVVVGIVRRPLDLGEQSASGGLLVLTPAFDRAYTNRIGVFGLRIRVRTVNGAADVPRVLAASRRILGASLFNAQGLAVESQGASNAIVALLGGLALLAVGHALVTSVRRRRRDLALLKTLGFTPAQVRATVAWQATTLASVGLIAGVPTGVIIGELIWRLVADGLGVSTAAPFPFVAVVLTALGTLALTNLVAFLPALAAARIRPGTALRSR